MTDSSFIEKITIKLFSYLTAGVQAFSYNISHFGETIYSHFPNATLVPFNSFISKFGLSSYYSGVTDYAVPTGFPQEPSNVNTMFGTLYLFNGLLGGCFLLFFWTALTVFLRNISLKSQNPFDIVLTALFYSAFILGWFELYFIHTFWIYLIIISYIFKYIIGRFYFNTKTKRLYYAKI